MQALIEYEQPLPVLNIPDAQKIIFHLTHGRDRMFCKPFGGEASGSIFIPVIDRPRRLLQSEKTGRIIFWGSFWISNPPFAYQQVLLFWLIDMTVQPALIPVSWKEVLNVLPEFEEHEIELTRLHWCLKQSMERDLLER